jgi:hypothetical protein
MFMDGHSNEARNELIFSHEGNARAAASVILVGVIAALIGSVLMAIGPKFKPAPRPAATIGAASTPVRIVGQVPHDNVPCDQQVWPNITQHCLVRKEVTPKSENMASTARTDDLSPLPAVPPSSQGAVSMSTPLNSASPAPRRQESLDLAESSDEAITPYYDDADELRQQEYMDPPPRKRQRRHYRSFHFHFGAFRF